MKFSTEDFGSGGSHLVRQVNLDSNHDFKDGNHGEIPISMVQVFHQVRGIPFEDLDVNDLIPSIREHGILQALLVCPISEGDGYALIAGHRRLRAAILLGLNRVPVTIKPDVIYDPENPENNETFTCLQLTENLQRQDLNPLQECLAIRQYRDRFGLNHSQLSAKLGLPRTNVLESIKIASFFEPKIEGVGRPTPESTSGEQSIPSKREVLISNPSTDCQNLPVGRPTPKNGPSLPGVGRPTPYLWDERIHQEVLKLSRSGLLLLASVGDQPYFDAVLRRLLDRESIRSVKSFIKTQQKRVESSQKSGENKATTIKNLVKISVDPTVSGISAFDFDPKSLTESCGLDPSESQEALASFRRNLLACIDSGLSKLFPNQRFELSVNFVLCAGMTRGQVIRNPLT